VTAEAYEGKMMATLENQMLKEKENKFIDDEHIHKVKNEMQMNSKAPNLEA
jgi:NifB/MoaA-like Fe-S oxidoreductase